MIESGIIKHSKALEITQRLEVLNDVGCLSEIKFRVNIAVAELDTAFDFIYTEHLDMNLGPVAFFLLAIFS